MSLTAKFKVNSESRNLQPITNDLAENIEWEAWSEAFDEKGLGFYLGKKVFMTVEARNDGRDFVGK